MEKNKYNGGFQGFIPKILVILIIFASGLWVGQNVASPFGNNQKIINLTNSDTPSSVTVDFGPFWDVWDQVTNKHLNNENIDPQKLLYGAISGMVSAVGDPYSVFLDPTQNSEFLSSLAGTFEGVGIELGSRDGSLVVVAPLEGTPAEAAGVRAGDKIVGIDGEDATEITIPEAVQKIRGKAGTKVILKLVRGDKDPFDVEIVRGNIKVKSVRLTTEEDKQIIRLSRFGDNTRDEWDGVINKIVTADSKKVILDMRNNPGGRLDFAVYVARGR
jgi:carboxyl-terminal processing protease